MAKIKSLYDALIKTQIKEDQCTNFLVWLLEKLPSRILLEICKKAELSIAHVSNNINAEVQTLFNKSRPDALIEFSEGKFLIIETKIYPNSFNKEQFLNHFNGGKDELGAENIWLLFLSNDESIPDELIELQKKHFGRIGFISWKSLIKLLRDNIESLGEKFEIITNEFLIFANNYKLGRLVSMNNEDFKRFIQAYPIVAKYQEVVLDKISDILNQIKDHIIIECEELVVENNDDTQEELPCVYRGLNIKDWYIKESSAYIFIDILQAIIGIVLTGYQENKKEKAIFQSQWEKSYKHKYKSDPSLRTFTWIGEDEYAINGGYFKIVEGTSGKIFNPILISEFSDYFYWGYVYDLDIEKIKDYIENIPKDFKKLLDTFLEN